MKEDRFKVGLRLLDQLESAEEMGFRSCGHGDGDGIGADLRGIGLDGDHSAGDDGNVGPGG